MTAAITNRMMKLKDEDRAKRLKGVTLVVASVGVGNLGQLCAELVALNTGAALQGPVYCPALPAVAAPAPAGSGLLSALDLYLSESSELAVLLLRSYCPARHSITFVNELIEFIKRYEISSVVILASRFASEQKSVQFPVYSYYCTQNYDFPVPSNEAADRLGWSAEFVMNEDQLSTSTGNSWVTRLALECGEVGLACCLISAYCSEGDNTGDASRMLHFLNARFGFLPKVPSEYEDFIKNIKVPSSWQYLFGNPPPIEIY